MQSAGKLLLCSALLLLCLAAAGASDSEVQVPSPEQDADQKPADSPRAETASREGADREDKSAAAPPAASPEAATEATAAVVDTELLMMGVGAIATLGAMAGGWFLMNQGGPKKRKFKGDAIFLVGACDSGKTAVMMQLRDGKTEEKIHPTHSSMQFNESTFALADMDGKPVRIIDCPGHSRLRPQLFDMIEDCAAVVFVIDSCTFASKAREIASFVLDLLTSEKMLKNCTNMLILCNKTDALPDELAGISPKTMVKKRLETEIEALRLARAEALDDIANSLRVELEIAGSAFKWSDAPVEVEFADASVRDGKLEPLKSFIANAGG